MNILGHLVVPLAAMACDTTGSRPWPSSIMITAATAGDIDGDGNTDLLLSGHLREDDERTDRLYVVDGKRDLDLASKGILVSYSAQAKLSHSLGLLLITELDTPLVIVAEAIDNGDGVPITFIRALKSSDLEEVWAESTTDTPTLVSMQLIHHHSDAWLYVGVGARLLRIPAASIPYGGHLESVQPPATLTEWPNPVYVASTPMGNDITVATSDAIFTAPDASRIVSTSWEVVRQGPVWPAQTVTDIDLDGKEEIIGLDTIAAQLCAVATAPILIGCTPLEIGNGTQNTRILAGEIAGTPRRTDVMVAQELLTSVRAEIVTAISLDGNVLLYEGKAVADIADNFHLFDMLLLETPVSSQRFVVFVDVSGAAECRALRAGEFVPCE